MLAVPADFSKLPSYVIQNCSAVPKEQLPVRVYCQRQPESWRTNKNGLVASVVKQKAKGSLENMGDAGVGCIKELL